MPPNPRIRGGFKRSRALWDATREKQPTFGETCQVWFQAICYELQPIRLNTNNETTNLTQTLVNFVKGIGRMCWKFVKSMPNMMKWIWRFLLNRTKEQWMIVAAIIAYYFLVRWIHEMLDAGPIVLIVTCLVGIFTIGLGDDDNHNGLSAYSVFNRGFERLLGSVDADALLAQHVGGGMGGMMNIGVGGNGPANNNNHWRDEEDDDADGGRRRRQRRNADGVGAAAAARNNDNAENGDVDGNDEDNNNNPNNNRSRKSGKKARRRNLDERRELRQQREAAIALGMDDGDQTQEDIMAMQRLIEEQLAANANGEQDE